MNIEPSACNYLIVTPIGPFFLDKDGPKGVKGATEEDKNEVRRAWQDGPDGSMSMGWKEASPSPIKGHCEQTLQENKVTTKMEPKRWEIAEDARLNEGFLYRGMTCPPRLGFLK